MLNIIRADLYRIFRGKGVYITLILLLALLVMHGVTGIAGGIIIETATVAIDSEGNIIHTNIPPKFTGSTAPFMMMINTDNLFYFFLPFIIFIAAADFSTDAVKNVLSNGMSRIKYYSAKLILCCVFCIIVISLNIIVPIITATIVRGFGGDFNMDFIGRVLRPFSAQLFMCLAVTCIGVFFVFATKRTAAVIGAYIAFFFLPLLLTAIVSTINDNLMFLFHYEIVMNIKLLATIDAAATGDIIRAFIIGGFYMLASTVGGIFLFKRSEIR